jgi:preprotein translocase subunit SecD
LKIFNYRLIIFALSIIFGVVFAMPSFLQTESGKKINLGLDLQGGLHMLLGVNVDEAVSSKIKSYASSIKYFAQDEDILLDELIINDDTIDFSILDEDEITKVDEMLSKIKGLTISKPTQLNYLITLSDDEKAIVKDLSVSQAVETIRNRLDQFGLAEPTVIRQGETDIVVELPGIKNAADEKAARELISRPANLELMAVDEEIAAQVYNMTPQQAAQYGAVILEKSDNPNEKYLVKEIPILNGESNYRCTSSL